MFRAGVVFCQIWAEVGMEGEFLILVHYIHTKDGPVATAAFSRYRGEITDICEKFRTLKLVPDWRLKVPGYRAG